MTEHRVELQRSGFVDWNYAEGGGEIWGLLLIPVAFVANVLVNLLVFRGGWTIHVHAANGGYRKIRYRSKKKAAADLENQRALADTVPAPPPRKPSRLPKWLQEPD